MDRAIIILTCIRKLICSNLNGAVLTGNFSAFAQFLYTNAEIVP
jgi:hypothetical protein